MFVVCRLLGLKSCWKCNRGKNPIGTASTLNVFARRNGPAAVLGSTVSRLRFGKKNALLDTGFFVVCKSRGRSRLVTVSAAFTKLSEPICKQIVTALPQFLDYSIIMA